MCNSASLQELAASQDSDGHAFGRLVHMANTYKHHDSGGRGPEYVHERLAHRPELRSARAWSSLLWLELERLRELHADDGEEVLAMNLRASLTAHGALKPRLLAPARRIARRPVSHPDGSAFSNPRPHGYLNQTSGVNLSRER